METVLITGASRGIGLELAHQFSALGYFVIATYRGQPSPALAQWAKEQGEQCCKLCELEVTDAASIARLSSQLQGHCIDILINNAGTLGGDQQTWQTIDASAWLETFSTNTIAPFMISRALLPNLVLSSTPRIVTISSQMGSLLLEGMGGGKYAYRSSKAALNKVMQTFALDLADQGVIVCLVHPGWVQTDMGGKAADLTPQESAHGIAHLARHLTLDHSGKFLTWKGTEHVW